MTTSSAEPLRAATDVVVEAVERLRSTDPADTAASLVAARYGFVAADAVGRYLARVNLDDAVLVRNTRPVMAAVDTCLRSAPSLPDTDTDTDHVIGTVFESIGGLVPDDRPAVTGERPIVYHHPDVEVDDSSAGVVRCALQALALELNTLLPQAAEHARDPADRAACEHGARLSFELNCCWEGRPSTFLNDIRNLGPRPHAHPELINGHRHGQRKGATNPKRSS